MLLKLCFLILMALGDAFGDDYTPSTDEYLLLGVSKLLNPIDGYLFDGPASISNAPATNLNKLPNLNETMFYNYYAASTYFGYDVLKNDLSCEYCLKYKPYVYKHEGNK